MKDSFTLGKGGNIKSGSEVDDETSRFDTQDNGMQPLKPSTWKDKKLNRQE